METYNETLMENKRMYCNTNCDGRRDEMQSEVRSKECGVKR